MALKPRPPTSGSGVPRVPPSGVRDPTLVRLTPTTVLIGAKLRYLGDQTPYAGSFLKGKGASSGKFLLPVFEGNYSADVKWFDTPGDDRADYSIIGKVTDRKHKKTSKKLDDLFLIKCSGFQKFTIGLTADDVCAKFVASFMPDAFNGGEEVTDAVKMAAARNREQWQNETQNDGW